MTEDPHRTTEDAREGAEELDVDAPNESAPGHEPDPDPDRDDVQDAS